GGAGRGRRAAGAGKDPALSAPWAGYRPGATDGRPAAVIPAWLDGTPSDEEETTAARRAAPAEIQALVDAAHRAGVLRPDVTSGDIGMLIVRLSRPLAGFPPEIQYGLSHRHLNLLIDGLRATARQPAELGGPALT